MASDSVKMAGKHDTSSLLCNGISSIEPPGGNIFQGNKFTFKNPAISWDIMTNVNVPCLFSRLASMRHQKGTMVVLLEEGSICLGNMKFI